MTLQSLQINLYFEQLKPEVVKHFPTIFSFVISVLFYDALKIEKYDLRFSNVKSL